MLQPLKIGSLVLPTNIIQGPLAGYSCSAFRELIWHYGNVAYCTTEMLSANNIVHRPNQPLRYRHRSHNEKILCVQLAGSNPDILCAATEIVNSWGAELIDLNCGCPQPKIRKKNMGSALLATPDIIYQCISLMRQATDAALSVKIRVSATCDHKWNAEVAQAIESAGADVLVVHGRHWGERYDVPVRLDDIAWFVRQLTIPVIANGDVADYVSLKNILDTTKCAGVMVSRAGLGRPWLFKSLALQSEGLPGIEVGYDTCRELLLRHIRSLVELDGEKVALLQARKLLAYYFANVTLSNSQQERHNHMRSTITTENDLISLL